MQSAPIIVVAEIQAVWLDERPRDVEKPPEIGGPMTPRIPLVLAKISANVVLELRGSVPAHFEFYSWLWAGGSHGGPRLFNPQQKSLHVLFLRNDSGHLHTVADYPNSDVEIRQPFLANWRNSNSDLPLFERLASSLLRADLETLDDADQWYLEDRELAGLTSNSYIGNQVKALCQNLPNPIGREKACRAQAERPIWNDPRE